MQFENTANAEAVKKLAAKLTPMTLIKNQFRFFSSISVLIRVSRVNLRLIFFRGILVQFAVTR
jgi:hypothetical protein